MLAFFHASVVVPLVNTAPPTIVTKFWNVFAPVKLLFPAANTSPLGILATLSSTYFFVAAIKSAVGLPLSVKSPVIVPPVIGSFVESAIVMFAVPSKDTPFIVRAVCNFVAVAELPV